MSTNILPFLFLIYLWITALSLELDKSLPSKIQVCWTISSPRLEREQELAYKSLGFQVQDDTFIFQFIKKKIKLVSKHTILKYFLVKTSIDPSIISP